MIRASVGVIVAVLLGSATVVASSPRFVTKVGQQSISEDHRRGVRVPEAGTLRAEATPFEPRNIADVAAAYAVKAELYGEKDIDLMSGKSWVFHLGLLFLWSAACFALGLTVALCLLRFKSTWPNSYIVDSSTLEESSLDLFISRLKIVQALLVHQCYGSSPSPSPLDEPPELVHEGSFYTAVGMLDTSNSQLDVEHCPTGFGTLQCCPDMKFRRQNSANRRAFWSPGDGCGLGMRNGPHHRRNRHRQDSNGHMYECISCDIIKAGHKIESVLGSVMPVPPHHQVGSGVLSWTSACPLPRIVCVNVQLPSLGLNPLGYHDPGCSIVSLFHITGETVQMAEHPDCQPCLKLFKEFCRGPCGRLDNRLSRSNPDKTGVLKAIAYCSNLEECIGGLGPMAGVATKFNGKPCLITKSGNMTKGPEGEWIEVSVDLRIFASAARLMLQKCRDRIAMACIHVGFLIQGMEDDELPEGLIGDTILANLHLDHDPVELDACVSEKSSC